MVDAIVQSLLVSCRECSHVHVLHHFGHLSNGVYPLHNVCIVVIAASKEPLSVARQLLVARLNGITSYNNSEVSFVTFYCTILNHMVCQISPNER